MNTSTRNQILWFPLYHQERYAAHASALERHVGKVDVAQYLHNALAMANTTQYNAIIAGTKMNTLKNLRDKELRSLPSFAQYESGITNQGQWNVLFAIDRIHQQTSVNQQTPILVLPYDDAEHICATECRFYDLAKQYGATIIPTLDPSLQGVDPSTSRLVVDVQEAMKQNAAAIKISYTPNVASAPPQTQFRTLRRKSIPGARTWINMGREKPLE